MIPKHIHYCWFGGKPKPRLARRCMESWARFAPGYAVTEWNERNFDVNALPFTRDAYAAGNYAYVSDCARGHALLTQGGIYLDTDVELLRPLDEYLDDTLFAGLEAGGYVGTAVLGSAPGQPLWEDYLAFYHNAVFGQYHSTNVRWLTDYCEARGLDRFSSLPQRLACGVTIYPEPVFSPYDYRDATLRITPASAAVHHFSASWFPWRQRLRQRAKAPLRFLKELPYKAGKALLPARVSRALGRLYTRFWALLLLIKNKGARG